MPPRTTDDRAHPAPGLMAGRTTAPPLMHVPALLVGAGSGLTRARPVGGLAVRMLGCGVLVAACLLVLFADLGRVVSEGVRGADAWAGFGRGR